MAFSINNQNYLFLCGVPRSGTSALHRILNSSKNIALGHERYGKFFAKNDIHKFNKEIFLFDKYFCDIDSDVHNERRKKLLRELLIKYKKSLFIGDKIPELYRQVPHLLDEFQNCKIIILYRDIEDVAASYNTRNLNKNDLSWPKNRDYTVAVRDWNEAVHNYHNIYKFHKDRILVVYYKYLFGNKPGELLRILNFLDLKNEKDIHEQYYIENKKFRPRLGNNRKKYINTEDDFIYLKNNAEINLFKLLLNDIS